MLSFNEAFAAVFDENGNVKPCGRQACRDLIEQCNKYMFGNLATGMMNVNAILGLKKDMDSGGVNAV